MSLELAQKFKVALTDYLNNPHDKTTKSNLVAVADEILTVEVQKCGLEPDKCFINIEDNIVKPAVQDIKIGLPISFVMDSFIRDLSDSDDAIEMHAFHVLNIALYNYLKPEAEKVIRDKLKSVEDSIQLNGETPYLNELQQAHQMLTATIDYYFKLSPENQAQNYEKFQKKLQYICSEHKEAIESDAQLKSTFYSFLATILSIVQFLGVNLSDKYLKRSKFFQEVSDNAQNTLSEFSDHSEVRVTKS